VGAPTQTHTRSSSTASNCATELSADCPSPAFPCSPLTNLSNKRQKTTSSNPTTYFVLLLLLFHCIRKSQKESTSTVVNNTRQPPSSTQPSRYGVRHVLLSLLPSIAESTQTLLSLLLRSTTPFSRQLPDQSQLTKLQY
jgi:hypothetical protein